jgi:hypothetical protein
MERTRCETQDRTTVHLVPSHCVTKCVLFVITYHVPCAYVSPHGNSSNAHVEGRPLQQTATSLHEYSWDKTQVIPSFHSHEIHCLQFLCYTEFALSTSCLLFTILYSLIHTTVFILRKYRIIFLPILTVLHSS